MIDLHPASSGNTLVFEAIGVLNSRDYEVDFAPIVERAIREHGKINLVLHLDEQFEGWDLGAIWDDARFGLKHRHDFAHVAVVGAQTWFKWAMQIGAKVIDGEFRTFPAGHFEQAIMWANNDATADSTESAARR